ncbi:hypothetical protein [Mucilaginibacter dorajii]|uniref:Uncharacterized protein n=1 Tax=Mucilaginibacter dorajii TaxID=692994 RepID=A0ABP7QIY7_9SPHI|nr:hypothetical protein [Mucilaginibacter dorajii]MCS3736085.1 hypothetical protein [Mucilaginibacter dorajii]
MDNNGKSATSIKESEAFSWSVKISLAAVIGYAVLGRFNAVCSFLLVLPSLLIIIAYLLNVLINIVWGIVNRKKYDKSFIPLLINIVGFVGIHYCMPTINQNKAYPAGSYSLNTSGNVRYGSGLYVEYYRVFGGGFMNADGDAVYLTDRRNFRLYLGVEDEGSKSIDVTCNGDLITKGIHELGYRYPRQQTFSLKALQKGHVFD